MNSSETHQKNMSSLGEWVCNQQFCLVKMILSEIFDFFKIMFLKVDYNDNGFQLKI